MSKILEVEVVDGERLRIIYVRVREVARWERNPKLHDLEGIKESIKKYGFRDAPIWDGTLGQIPAGNGRATALLEMEEASEELPVGVLLDQEGKWAMPLQVGIDAATVEIAEAFAIDHNNLTMGGSGLSAYEVSLLWDDAYPGLIRQLKSQGEMPITVDDDDLLAIEQARLPPQVLPGEPGEGAEFLSFIKVKVGPDTMQRYYDVLDHLGMRSDEAGINRLLEMVEGAWSPA